jgi:hypothetical protein
VISSTNPQCRKTIRISGSLEDIVFTSDNYEQTFDYQPDVSRLNIYCESESSVSNVFIYVIDTTGSEAYVQSYSLYGKYTIIGNAEFFPVRQCYLMINAIGSSQECRGPIIPGSGSSLQETNQNNPVDLHNKLITFNVQLSDDANCFITMSTNIGEITNSAPSISFQNIGYFKPYMIKLTCPKKTINHKYDLEGH